MSLQATAGAVVAPLWAMSLDRICDQLRTIAVSLKHVLNLLVLLPWVAAAAVAVTVACASMGPAMGGVRAC